jgi:hypothetical protein
MLVPAVNTDNRDRRVIKACFPQSRGDISVHDLAEWTTS